jgi:hypothetical protein
METTRANVEPETFERRLRAAVRAAAWLLFVPGGLILLQWFLYLAVMASEPAWFLALFGPGVDWPEVQIVWLGGMVMFKLFFWVHLVLVLWGALWASLLRKQAALRAPPKPADAPSAQPSPMPVASASH